MAAGERSENQSSGSPTVAVDADSSVASTSQEPHPTAPRRGGRIRKPTSKLEASEVPGTKKVDSNEQQKSKGRQARDAQTEPSFTPQQKDGGNVERTTEDDDDEDDDEDDQVYCICRQKDDGSFMISCEQCQEWFHTRCIGMTQKDAKKLDEYVCQACQAKSQKSNKGRKPIVKYKSKKGKRTGGTTPHDDEEQAHETHRSEDEPGGSASEMASDSEDGDEYIAEGAEASDEEATDDVHPDQPGQGSSAIKLPSRTDAVVSDHPFGSRRAMKRKEGDETASQSPKKLRTSSLSASGDASMKRRTSGGTEGPSSLANVRRPSTSQKQAVRKPHGPSDAVTEEARSRARKVLSEALTKIYAQHSGAAPKLSGSSGTTEEMLSDVEKGQSFATLLEQQLFEINADTLGQVKIVGSRYKDRFRTFLFSLKDAKNTSLHSRIASGELLAADLAKMTSDELANDVMRQATEKARLEALQRSTLRTESEAPLRKITHKGEVEIENEASEVRDQPGKFQRIMAGKEDQTLSESRKQTSREEPEASSPRRISESEPVVPSLASNSLKEDEDATMGDAHAEIEPSRRSAPAPSGPMQSPTTQIDFGSVWGPSMPEPSADEEELDSGIGKEDEFGPSFGDQDYENEDARNQSLDHADDFIDSFLDGKEREDAADEDRNRQRTEDTQVQKRSSTPVADPSAAAVHRYRSIIWNGLIDLPDIFAFRGFVKQVAGQSLAQHPNVALSFFPSKGMLVAGRLPSKAATDYILQVVNAPKTELLVFTIEPGKSTQKVVETNESDLASFSGMMKHFKDADRWGALHVSSKVKNVLIKDFYITPLYKDQEVPLWLDLAESDCLGADWHLQRDRDLFLMVAVVIRDALQQELRVAASARARSESSSSATPQVPSRAPQGVPDPSAPLSSVEAPPNSAGSSSFASDALQTLLKTLGKTTPQSSNATPPHQLLSTATAPQLPNGSRSPYPVSAAPGYAPLGPPPPGPPPPMPPALSPQGPAPGEWAGTPPHLAGNMVNPAQQDWQYQQGGAPGGYDQYPQYGDWNAGNVPGWGSAPPAAEPVQVPEEEYPGQYNPEYLAESSRGTFSGRGQTGHAGFNYNRGRGWVRGRGRGRGRGW